MTTLIPPRVSVVIPTYNRASLLSRAVDSVLGQTYQDFEIVIVDDCSTDDTRNVTAALQSRSESASGSRPCITVRRHRLNRGNAAALNTGIFAARGEYIALLDDDDEWLSSKLQKQVAVLDAASENVALVYGWLDAIDDETGHRFPLYRETMRGCALEAVLGMRLPSPNSTLMFRASAVRSFGGLREGQPKGNDVYLITRIAQSYELELVPEVLCLYHVKHGHAQMSDETRESAAQGVEFVNQYLELFDPDLSMYPRSKARVWRRMAAYKARAGQRLGAAQAGMRSLALDPAGSAAAALSNGRLIFSLLRSALRVGRDEPHVQRKS